MDIPKNKLTLGVTEYENTLLTAKVTRIENGFDSATIAITDTTLFPGTVTAGTAIKLEVADEGDAYPTDPMFKGVVRFPILDISSKQKLLTLSCLGAGYGLGQMLVAQEYGTQSKNPTLNTITDIITNIDVGLKAGIITYYINGVLGTGTSSGFSYASVVANIADVINYISFPYKPALGCFNDLVDLVTALKAGSAGCHWIVTTDDTIRLKLVNGSLAGWTKYYRNSQANATLTYGVDYDDLNFETVGPEANYILYYGAWRRPSNGDAWTENNAADWVVAAPAGCVITDDTDAGDYRVNTASILITGNSAVNAIVAIYPTLMDWGYDFSSFREYNVPNFNFWAKRNATLGTTGVRLSDAAGNYFEYQFDGDLVNANQWYHISLPVGDYYKTAGGSIWDDSGGGTWDDIDYMAFVSDPVNGATLHVDGIHFGDAAVCRVASNSGISPYAMKLITDNVGKDDSLVAADASGIMAQLAYAELLRVQKTCYVGNVTVPMLPEALPGQWFYLQKDMRCLKIVQTIMPKPVGYQSTLFLTDDVTNGRSRLRYEDLNKQYADIRPEFQDRQASSIKAGQIDIRVPRLARNYP